MDWRMKLWKSVAVLGDGAVAIRARITPAALRAVVLLCLLLAPGCSKESAKTAVVPPGQEALLANILGQGSAFPGPCAFASGSIDGGAIRGVYACPRGEVGLELHEPSQATASVAETDKFAISLVRGGPPPAEFVDALRSHIAARESAFEWQWVSPHDEAEPASPHTAFPVPPWVTAGQYFFVLLSAGVLVALWRSRARLMTREAVVPAVLFLLALALRFAAHAVPADIRAVLEQYSLARLGWSAFLHLVYATLPERDETFWTISRFAGALAVPLLYAVVRARFTERLVAVGAAAMLAVTPLLVRFSATDTPYILLSAAFLGAIVAYDRFAASASASAMALALALLTAAMQLRPDAPWLIVPAACLVLARPLPRWRTFLRPSLVACALAFVALNTAATLAAVAATGRVQGGYWEYVVVVAPILRSPWGVGEMTPPTLAVLVAFGALAALFNGRAGALWLLAVLIANPFSFPADSYRDGLVLGQYANARYYIPAMYLACGLGGLGVAALVRALGRLARRDLPAPAAVAVGIVCLAAAPGLDLLWRMWTPQREFEFFRSGLAQLDPACRLVTLSNTRDAGFIPFDYLVPGRTLDLVQFLADPHGSCFVYYRTANCYSPDILPEAEPATFVMHPACREIEDRFDLRPIVVTDLPVLPYRAEIYARDPLPVGFFAVNERSASAAAAAPPP